MDTIGDTTMTQAQSWTIHNYGTSAIHDSSSHILYHTIRTEVRHKLKVGQGAWRKARMQDIAGSLSRLKGLMSL